jgi:hypothetical protein
MNAIFESGSEYDYLIMIDIDIEFFNIEKLVESMIQMPADADAIFANGRYFYQFGNKQILTNYYDTYALEIGNKQIVPDKLLYLYKKMKTERFVECKSAFGGIGIYKYPVIKNKYYTYCEDNKKSVCEHIPFNHYLEKLYIDKKLIVLYENISFLQFLWYIIIPMGIKKIVIQ